MRNCGGEQAVRLELPYGVSTGAVAVVAGMNTGDGRHVSLSGATISVHYQSNQLRIMAQRAFCGVAARGAAVALRARESSSSGVCKCLSASPVSVAVGGALPLGSLLANRQYFCRAGGENAGSAGRRRKWRVAYEWRSTYREQTLAALLQRGGARKRGVNIENISLFCLLADDEEINNLALYPSQNEDRRARRGIAPRGAAARHCALAKHCGALQRAAAHFFMYMALKTAAGGARWLMRKQKRRAETRRARRRRAIA